MFDSANEAICNPRSFNPGSGSNPGSTVDCTMCDALALDATANTAAFFADRLLLA